MSFLPRLHQLPPLKSAAVMAAGGLMMAGTIASADASERRYFSDVQGTWSGAGTIVAGPYKNTRFTCKLSGNAPGTPGMKLSGKCRVGLFSQPIEATVAKRGGRYRGRFLDGAKGKGLDIVSGKLRGKKLVLGIKRKKLKGTMVANLKSRNKLNITISVLVDGGLVPFIGLTLNRTGARKASY
ncbi:MAG: hypothetical protein AAFQ10_08435 [Pseudomonadota bacterium]